MMQSAAFCADAAALTNGYAFDDPGEGKASDHPVQTVSWYDCVKWCNARSEKGIHTGRKVGLVCCAADRGAPRRSMRDVRIAATLAREKRTPVSGSGV